MDLEVLASYLDQNLVDPTQLQHERRRRNIKSKIDNLSVKVKIGQYQYVLSRFSLSRYLMACQVPTNIAVAIPGIIKKDLIQEQNFEITQEELNERVFQLISAADDSSQFVYRFGLIQQFYMERVPFIIFLSGTGFIGKSSLAFQLGERLNITTVLQTDIVGALVSNTGNFVRKMWYDTYESKEHFLQVYRDAAQVVSKGIEGDIIKTLVDGKPIIIEGVHLDPEYYLASCGGNSLLPIEGFGDIKLGSIAGKKGFILPLILTRSMDEIRNCIRATIYGSPCLMQKKPEVTKILEYAYALQTELEKKFPDEYRINCSGSEGVDEIHTLFLRKLEEHYRRQELLSAES